MLQQHELLMRVIIYAEKALTTRAHEGYAVPDENPAALASDVEHRLHTACDEERFVGDEVALLMQALAMARTARSYGHETKAMRLHIVAGALLPMVKQDAYRALLARA